jgi:hypothetical protein
MSVAYREMTIPFNSFDFLIRVEFPNESAVNEARSNSILLSSNDSKLIFIDCGGGTPIKK